MPTNLQSHGYLLLGTTSFDGGGNSNLNYPQAWTTPPSRCRRCRRFKFFATVNRLQNHYSTLGVSTNASSSDIKKSYRLLALKYHPDVNKELGADEAFKSIRLAYDILIDEKRRNQYDRDLRHQENAGRSSGDNWVFNPEYEDGQRIYRWAYLRRKMKREKYWEQYQTEEKRFSFYDEVYEESEEENTTEERGSFVEVLRSAFLSLFLMQTVGTHLSLTFSSLMALLDRKLDTGYKVGYLFAWLLGGRGGILLTVFLSFASWVCGKTSSSVVAVVVVAMWFGSNLARRQGKDPERRKL
ncbi:Chaperone DnaJ-domain superfamily protein [Forsythia ovata]|uniref:Chaperone DnaJ-domain superfamily protein n=1 Tax=Forsythia ovata TaxID=205694 RepID=A0ABD1R436_9LAMI